MSLPTFLGRGVSGTYYVGLSDVGQNFEEAIFLPRPQKSEKLRSQRQRGI